MKGPVAPSPKHPETLHYTGDGIVMVAGKVKPPFEIQARKSLKVLRPMTKPTPTLYGIPNCDTIKKARTWLADKGIAYAFHDYKKDGIERASLESWCKKAGWETVLNRAGTTFRALPDAGKKNLDQEKAIALMLEQPSMIKRPVLDLGKGKLIVGFKPEIYAAAFNV